MNLGWLAPGKDGCEMVLPELARALVVLEGSDDEGGGEGWGKGDGENENNGEGEGATALQCQGLYYRRRAQRKSPMSIGGRMHVSNRRKPSNKAGRK